MNILNRHFGHTPIEAKVQLITQILHHPEDYLNDEYLNVLAGKLIHREEQKSFDVFELSEEPAPFHIQGRHLIGHQAIHQMELAMRLPVSRRGALMPDAHPGFGLPIGGVLATKNVVIPHAVGMDIGCRMALSVLDLPGSYALNKSHELKKMLSVYTHFGNEGGLEFRQEHDVLDHPHFNATELLRRLKGKAARQLGTSGNGNHFVEFGIYENENSPGEEITRLATLSHSGSRGLGANIAEHYTRIAMDKCKLPPEVKKLAWLDLASEDGQAYWLSMNLAGDYAKACHDQIHKHLCEALGATIISRIENHHNFAWEEVHQGEKLIVHRKGATPAQADVYGIIPGSMTTPAFVVTGAGDASALCSASHGAGRAYSRQAAGQRFTMREMKTQLAKHKVTLMGGNADEAPMAYKDIHEVMCAQQQLVRVKGMFYPKVVRMSKD